MRKKILVIFSIFLIIAIWRGNVSAGGTVSTYSRTESDTVVSDAEIEERGNNGEISQSEMDSKLHDAGIDVRWEDLDSSNYADLADQIAGATGYAVVINDMKAGEKVVAGGNAVEGDAFNDTNVAGTTDKTYVNLGNGLFLAVYELDSGGETTPAADPAAAAAAAQAEAEAAAAAAAQAEAEAALAQAWAYHSRNGCYGGTATCTTKARCALCGHDYGDALGHNYVCKNGTATCANATNPTPQKCSRCGDTTYENCSYTQTCSQPHCDVKICQWCRQHQDTKNTTCDGGCNSNYCTHCQAYYCNKTTKTVHGHTCQHNTNGKCDNVHCVGMTWCTNCERVNGINSVHTHRTCSDFSSSFQSCDNGYAPPNGHCTAKVCPKCKAHQTICGGGHVFDWQGNKAKATSTEKHKKTCTVSGCTATSNEHDPSWGQANTSHTATCTTCNYYTYTHAEAYTDKNNPHKCVGNNNKCSASHAPVWGAYYKINENEHTRKCTFGNCVVVDTPHQFVNISDNPWSWNTADNHIKTCQYSGCGLTTTLPHSFNAGDPAYDKKTPDSSCSELYKHWLVCKTCDATVPNNIKPHGNVDEAHSDDGTGKCSKCGQVLWKMVKIENAVETNITDNVLGINTNKLSARNQQEIKIIENKNGTVQYVQSIFDENSKPNNATNNVITIRKNGTYTFTTCRGGTATFNINHISEGVIIDRIIDPVTSTKGTVTITLRSAESEKEFNKDIYIKSIKEGNSISDSELNSGSNPYTFSETVSQNGTYTFIARDTAGNEETIEIVIDNIIKGQATVAISNDVFINGYAFTEILINPNESWTINKSNITSIVNASVYKIGNTTPVSLSSSNIRLVKVMDIQRRDITDSTQPYPAGEYYLQIAIGGSIFNEKGTYIIDLKDVKSNTKTLKGQNRIIVEVQDLKDLT